MNNKRDKAYMKRRFSAVFLAVIMCFGIAGCSFGPWHGTGSDSSNQEGSAEQTVRTYAEKDLEAFNEFTLDVFCDAVSQDTLTLHCMVKNPENYGIEHTAATLGTIDINSLDNTSDITDCLNRLNTFRYEELSQKQQLTYDIMKNYLTTELEYSDLYMYSASLTPYSGITVMLPTLLAEYEFYSKADVDDYIALLNDTGRYFSDIMEFERLRSEKGLFMEDYIADELIGQCRTFIDKNSSEDSFLITSFASRLNDVSQLTDTERNAYIEANRKAVISSVLPAYQDIIDGIASLKGTNRYQGGLCNYPDGRKYYEYLVKSDLGWSKSMNDLDELLDQYITSAYLSLQAILAKDPSVADRLDHFSFTLTDPEEIVNDLHSKLTDEFPAAPEVEYSIRDIDKSLEENANPAMYIIPQIDNYTGNVILINRYQADYATIYPMLAHEGYPGHMYQTTYFAATNPDPVRRILQTGGYSEGWASYVEILSYMYDDKSSSDSIYQLLKDNETITLALYSKMDMGVNYYGWTKDRLRIFLQDWGVADGMDIDRLYGYLCAEPASYPKYSLGCFAFMDLRVNAQASLGERFDAVEFHRFLMNLGPAPFDIVYERFDRWLASQTDKS